ncbi:MAG: radical SAM protein [Myxococcota bacterium]
MPLVALVHPPSADPTAPYLAVPMLTGFLRARAVDVLPVDANVEAYDWLFSRDRLGQARDHIDARLAALDALAALDHEQQLEHAALVEALADAHAVPAGIDAAKATLRDPVAFYDARAYADATTTIDAALRVVSAAHYPLQLDFTAWRTPLGLLTMDEVERASGPALNPFHAWVADVLAPRLRAAGAAVVGLSTAFPGQLQAAYAFGFQLRALLPGVHLTIGGPGITQMLIRLKGHALAQALGPFDSAVVFEGEHTLLELVKALDEGTPLAAVGNVVLRQPDGTAAYRPRPSMEDLRQLPAPDFDGLPLDLYFAPRAQLTLPYDPTRGCYWGKCTFCHYGLAEVGTASYRERLVPDMVAQLRAMSQKYGTRHFYLSQDSVAPKTLDKLAQGLVAAGLELRWGTDLKAEKYLTAERARTLRAAGAVACAIGVESANPRVLKLIDKGPGPDVIASAMHHLAQADVAAEAMCFTDFPTETFDEALETLQFLADREDDVAVYIVGRFGLTHGSLVAQRPDAFGIAETWQVDGDELGLGLFFRPRAGPWKSASEAADVDLAMDELKAIWFVRPYPWAGAVSTAHTLLHYDRFGPGVFRALAAMEPPVVGRILGAELPFERALRFDPERTSLARERDAAVWERLVTGERRVGRDLYVAAIADLPPLSPSPPRIWHFRARHAPSTSGKTRANSGGPSRGRRPDTAPSRALG